MTTEPRLHTEGPWKIGKAQWKRGGPPYKIPITGGAGGVICNVLIHESFQGDARNPIMPGPNANAALIARAPELAARVEELTEDIADHKQIIEDKRERNKELRAHNARLRGLLRECVEFLPMALQATIYEELGQ